MLSACIVLTLVENNESHCLHSNKRMGEGVKKYLVGSYHYLDVGQKAVPDMLCRPRLDVVFSRQELNQCRWDLRFKDSELLLTE